MLDVVDDAHGRHVVDAGVNADLVQDHDTGFPGHSVQRLHLLGDVAGGDHGLLALDAHSGHQGVKVGRHQAHSQVTTVDELAQLGLVLQVQLVRLPVGMVVDQFLGLGNRAAGADDLVVVVKQVTDQRLGNQAGSQHQHFLHLLRPPVVRPPPRAAVPISMHLHTDMTPLRNRPVPG